MIFRGASRSNPLNCQDRNDTSPNLGGISQPNSLLAARGTASDAHPAKTSLREGRNLSRHARESGDDQKDTVKLEKNTPVIFINHVFSA